MSTHEIQPLIYHKGQFTFIDGRQDEGMLVSRYNISAARIEYYFIPALNVLAYQAARSDRDFNAHTKLGQLIEISDILNAKVLN